MIPNSLFPFFFMLVLDYHYHYILFCLVDKVIFFIEAVPVGLQQNGRNWAPGTGHGEN